MAYALPSWRKELKDQFSKNVRKATKLDAIKWARSVRANDAQIVLGAHSGSALKRSEPDLHPRRDGERRSNLSRAALVKKGS